MAAHTNKFLERLAKQDIICGEGYVFELERRGYLQAGSFVPECVLLNPEAVLQLHRDFVRCGSDVVEACTYYAHREKLRLIGRENDIEKMNRAALRLARQVAQETDTLLAGNICNTNIWQSGDEKNNPETVRLVTQMFDEQVKWAKEEGADFIIAETIEDLGEAQLALASIRRSGLPAVITLSIHRSGKLRDGYEIEHGMKVLAEEGAAVVGFNCGRGPATMLPLLERIVKVVPVPVAALPVPYRTTEKEPTFFALTDPHLPPETVNGRPFPVALDGCLCTRFEIAEFTRKAKQLGVRYFGLCCGAGPHHLRAMAEALGRSTPASKYSPDMSKHFAFGTDKTLKTFNTSYKNEL